jgi:hypothetical protein
MIFGGQEGNLKRENGERGWAGTMLEEVQGGGCYSKQRVNVEKAPLSLRFMKGQRLLGRNLGGRIDHP